ncbi:hypothetical protein Taro_016978 [Colocasia esculenta]|uniref:BED-type domain-containing protein n=1 Tax=Colocasia esculenta TaxID=4460 RepID=A0A843UPZ5_COLES|nr:hypothetical protein [Colocasia esculenta]
MQEGRKVLPLPPQLGLPPPPPPPASSTAAGVLPSRPPPPLLLLVLLLLLLLLLLLPLLLLLLLFLLNPIFSFKFERGLASMADEGHEEEQPQVDIGWKHGVLIDAASKRVRCNHCGKEMNGGVYRLKQHIAGIGTNVLKCKHCPRELVNEMKDYMAGRQQQRGIRIQHQQELHEEISGKGKSKAATRTVDVEDSDDTDYEDLSPNEREWREGLRQSRRAAMLESDMRRFHSTREGSSSGTSVTRPPAPPIRRGGSMRGTGPTSGVDTILGRKSSSKQPSIKHAMKGMDRFKLKLDIYRDYDVKEAVTRMGPEREALSSQIDVDELFDEEHPLNAWVETRQERDVPEFDPRDCSWAKGELDGVEAGDPELRVSEDQPLTLGPLFSLPRHSAILPETSRVPPTQPALRRAATQKEKSSKALELEKITYARQKKRKVQQPIRSDDTTQDPNDDDDDDGAATGATGAG